MAWIFHRLLAIALLKCSGLIWLLPNWFLIAFLIYFFSFFAESHQTIDDGQFGIHSTLDKTSPLMTTCGLFLYINAQKKGTLWKCLLMRSRLSDNEADDSCFLQMVKVIYNRSKTLLLWRHIYFICFLPVSSVFRWDEWCRLWLADVSDRDSLAVALLESTPCVNN